MSVEVAGGGACYAELQGLVCGCGWWGWDAEEAEDGDVDGVDVGACAVDDEVLVQRREGKGWRRCSEEGEGRWDFAEHGAVEAVLFAFLALRMVSVWCCRDYIVGLTMTAAKPAMRPESPLTAAATEASPSVPRTTSVKV